MVATRRGNARRLDLVAINDFSRSMMWSLFVPVCSLMCLCMVLWGPGCVWGVAGLGPLSQHHGGDICTRLQGLGTGR
jgi:hypothetical protein